MQRKKNGRYFLPLLGALWLVYFSSAGFAAMILHVPQEYKSIQMAVDHAKPGDTVLVKPGNYPETLSLKAKVTVKSEGTDAEHADFTSAGRTIISSPGGQTFIVAGSGDAVLDGFTVTDNGTEFSSRVSRYGILIKGVSQTVTNCIIANLPYDGIAVIGSQGEAEAYIYNNLVFRNQGNGIECQSGARARIVKNLIHDNGRSGIENEPGAQTHVIGNGIFKNRIDGVMNTGAAPIIKNNDIFENGLNGIGLQRGARALIMGNKIHDNAQAGVGLRSQARGTVWDNRIYRNAIGIGCLDLADIKIESNEIYENLRIGIGLMGCVDGSVTINNNHIHGNRFLAISPNPGCNLVQNGNLFYTSKGHK